MSEKLTTSKNVNFSFHSVHLSTTFFDVVSFFTRVCEKKKE